MTEKEKMESLKRAIEIISKRDNDPSLKDLSKTSLDEMGNLVDDDLLKLLINQNYNDLASKSDIKETKKR